MSRTVIRYVLLALLFAGAERGLDLASDHVLHNHEHGDRFAHDAAIGDVPDENQRPATLTDCEHCPHGHPAGLVSDTLPSRPAMPGAVRSGSLLPPKLHGRSPPTPPPNA